ncbi:MAG: hypothetical protein JW894_11335 [Bacteroidales bacterium]|nr:hypothetical protein [Bacteroidales bacterium]
MRYICLTISFFLELTGIVLSGQSSYEVELRDQLYERWRWTEYSELQGSGYLCMKEAADRTIWFGVNDGIIHYDGISWVHYNKEDGLDGHEVNQIECDRDGTVFINTNYAIFKYTDDNWEKVFPLDSLWVGEFGNFQLVDEGMLIATFEGVIQSANDQVRLITSESKRDSLVKIFPEWNFFTMPSEIESKCDKKYRHFECHQNVVYQDRLQNIWFSFFNNLIKFSAKSPSVSSAWRIYNEKNGYSLGRDPLIRQLRNGEIWVLCEQFNLGIYSFNEDEIDYFELSDFGGNNRNVSIEETPDGIIWVGGYSLLHAFKDGKWVVYAPPEMPFPTARLTVDYTTDGNLWLGCKRNKIFRVKYDQNHWTSYDKLNFQASDKNGDLWFIDVNGFVVRYQSTDKKWMVYKNSKNIINAPVSVRITRAGDVWVHGSNNSTAAVSLFRNNEWKMYTFPELSYNIDYRAFCEADDGTVWLGAGNEALEDEGHKGGVIKVTFTEEGDINFKHFPAPVAPFQMSGMAQTCDSLLFSGGAYVNCFDGSQSFMVNKHIDFRSDWIDVVHRTNTGKHWIGKGGVGLFYYDYQNDSIRKFTVTDGIASNMTSFISSNSDSDVIVATDRGISRFDGYSWNTYAFPEELKIDREGGTIHVIDSNEIWINISSRAWFMRSIPSDSKIRPDNSEFYCVRYTADNNPPVTRLLIYPEKVSYFASTIVEWEGTDYLNETSKDELQFSYRIDEKEWSPFTKSSKFIIDNKQGGIHTFEVRCRDNAFNVESKPAIIRFKVIPPIYFQAWFIILMVSFLIIISYLGARVLRRRAELKKLNQYLLNSNNELNSKNTLLQERQLHIEEQAEELKVKNEQLSELNATKDKFFSIIGHDLRNPMNSILGFSELLYNKHQKLDNKKRELYIRSIKDSAKKTYDLLENLLEWSRSQSSQYIPKPEKISIDEILTNNLILLKDHYSRKDITVISEIDKDSEAFSDKNMVDTIIRNLITNAIKFTPSGGLVTISCQQANNQIIISVKDNGVGIPGNIADQIFNIDSSYHTKGTAGETGTGLGLILCKEFIEKNGGTIWMESEENKGSIFSFTLPVKR